MRFGQFLLEINAFTSALSICSGRFEIGLYLIRKLDTGFLILNHGHLMMSFEAY